MKAINYVVRTSAGSSQRGKISADNSVSVVDAGVNQEISFNLRQIDLQGYNRQGSDLEITLADGRVIVLEGYFNEDGSAASRLFISADGYLSEVALFEGTDGTFYAQYGPTAVWGKWSPSDDLIFLDGTEIAAPIAGDEQNVSMLGAGLIGGGSLLTAASVGGAGLAATTLVGGGDDGGGDDGVSSRIEPVVDQEEVIVVGGDDEDNPSITITGKADPGSDVAVTIGDKTLETLADDNGEWRVVFEGEDFPADGDHEVVVVVTEGDGTETTLDGPEVEIDTTPPEISLSDGTVSTGDITNAVDFQDGVEIAGTGEVGARVDVTIAEVTKTVVVNDGGDWSVVFGPGELPEGEYESEVTVVASDGFGNTTTLVDTVAIDTIAHDITINTGSVGGDGVVNQSEASNGVEVTGTSAPGATVTVTLEGQTQDVIVAQDGSWTAMFDAANLPGGQYEATITASTVDAAGNPSSTSGTIQIDTVVQNFAMNGEVGGADGVINAAEISSGFSMVGTVEPGSTVTVEFNGVTVNGVVAGDGSWTADFAGSQIQGGTYSANAVATAIDAAGNVSTMSQLVSVDTEAGALTLNSGQIGGDGTINASEAAQGVLVTGTADPGAQVVVTLGGVSHTVTANGAGAWQTTYASAEIAPGTYSSDVTATTMDAAGNSRSVDATVQVDTQVDNLDISDLNIAIGTDGGDVVNEAVADAGFAVTGTAEVGSTVIVSIDGVSHQAVVDGAGNWSAQFLPGDVADGEYQAALRVDVTDPAGNTSTLNDTVRVDTHVNALALSSTPIETDNVINTAEAADGVQITGQVEPGSSLLVTVFGKTHNAVVDAAGNWSVNVPAGDIPVDEATVAMTLTATDSAGNTATATEPLTIDLVAPEDPAIVGYFREGSGYRNATLETSDDDISIHQIDAGGNVNELSLHASEDAFLGETNYHFLNTAGAPTTIPDGSQLVVTSSDAAGNSSSAYVVLDETNTAVVDIANPNLANFQIETVDLRFGDQSQLTITEEQLVALSENTDTLVVRGGADDTVTITGASATGQTQSGGETFDVYSLGEDATIVVDDDINVVT